MLLGVGLATYVEITGGGFNTEFANVEVHDDGTATVKAGTSAHGQGHATTFSMLVADRLGIPMSSIRYLQSRTPNRFAALSRPGIDQPMQPDLALRYGLYDARGYDYPVERRYDEFWRANVAPMTGDYIEPTQRAGPTPRALHGLSLLGVSDLLQYPDGPPLRLPGLRLVYERN